MSNNKFKPYTRYIDTISLRKFSLERVSDTFSNPIKTKIGQIKSNNWQAIKRIPKFILGEAFFCS